MEQPQNAQGDALEVEQLIARIGECRVLIERFRALGHEVSAEAVEGMLAQLVATLEEIPRDKGR